MAARRALLGVIGVTPSSSSKRGLVTMFSRGDSLACGEEDQFREATLYSMLSIANSP